MNAEQTVKDICELEENRGEAYVDIRKKVLLVGQKVRELQELQKAEQRAAKKRGEQPQTWKEYVTEQKQSRDCFPAEHQCRQYIRISQYPDAHEIGMSIKEAYKMATAFKKNGGSPPTKAKVSIQSRLPNQIGNYLGKAVKRLEKYNEIEDWAVNASEEKWTEDDFAGMEEVLLIARQEINQAVEKLRAVMVTA